MIKSRNIDQIASHSYFVNLPNAVVEIIRSHAVCGLGLMLLAVISPAAADQCKFRDAIYTNKDRTYELSIRPSVLEDGQEAASFQDIEIVPRVKGPVFYGDIIEGNGYSVPLASLHLSCKSVQGETLTAGEPCKDNPEVSEGGQIYGLGTVQGNSLEERFPGDEDTAPQAILYPSLSLQLNASMRDIYFEKNDFQLPGDLFLFDRCESRLPTSGGDWEGIWTVKPSWCKLKAQIGTADPAPMRLIA